MSELETARTDQPTQPAESVATRIVELLAEEGYRPHLQEPDGPFRRILFKLEGTRFQVKVNEDDPDFVMICLGYLFDEPVPDVPAILRAGHDVQAEAKVAKFFLDPGGKFYEMQAELFLGGHPLNAQHLEKCVHVLRRAAADFSERLTTEAPRARA